MEASAFSVKVSLGLSDFAYIKLKMLQKHSTNKKTSDKKKCYKIIIKKQVIKRKLLNVITLGHTISDHINRMITLTKETLCLTDRKKANGLLNTLKN